MPRAPSLRRLNGTAAYGSRRALRRRMLVLEPLPDLRALRGRPARDGRPLELPSGLRIGSCSAGRFFASRSAPCAGVDFEGFLALVIVVTAVASLMPGVSHDGYRLSRAHRGAARRLVGPRAPLRPRLRRPPCPSSTSSAESSRWASSSTCSSRCSSRRRSRELARLRADRRLPRRARRGGEAARRVHGARLRGRAASCSRRRSAGSSASSTASRRAARRREARDALDDVRGRDAALQRRRRRRRLRASSACRASCRSTRDGMGAVSPDLSWNTAVSFVTNTNWQSYGGETTMSYLTQMVALAVQNFVCAASGMAVMVALIRGISRKTTSTLGNFWVDLDAQHALHPAAALDRPRARLRLAGRRADLLGRAPRRAAPGDEGRRRQGRDRPGPRRRPGRLAGWPSSSSAPTAAASSTSTPRTRSRTRRRSANFFEIYGAARHPGGAHLHVRQDGEGHAPGLGRPRGDVRRLPAAAVALRRAGAGRQPGARVAPRRPGRRARCRPAATWRARRCASASPASALFATATTGVSCGAVNAMHDSFTPLGGFVPLFLIQLGEVIFGGVGAGMYGMLMFAVVAVFVAGLMVGRTPEYLGKKIEAKEMKMASLAILVPRATHPHLHGDRRRDRGGPQGRRSTPGPHGFSEILYAFSSATGNNGSAFGGLSREHALLQHDPRPRDVLRPLLHQGPGPRARRVARREEDRPDRAPARCPRTRRSSSRCSSASSSSSAR